MAPGPKFQRRFVYSRGALAAALDDVVREQLGLEEGTEVELRVEDGKLVIEPIRPESLAPASDVAARAERQRKIAAAMRHVMDKHDEAFALLAK